MTLTDIRDQLVLLKQQILAQAQLYPAAADQLNIALAHLNDSANIVSILAMQLDPQRANATEAERAAQDRIAHLEAQLAAIGGQPQPDPEQIRQKAGPDGIDPNVTTDELAAPGTGDLIAGEGIDPEATVELGDPQAVATEATRKAAEQQGRTDPDQGRVDWG